MNQVLRGRIRYRFGLHCFARPGAWYLDRFAAHGFVHTRLVEVASITLERFDDVCDQHVVIATKDAAPE
jgi:hypothetical protein